MAVSMSPSRMAASKSPVRSIKSPKNNMAGQDAEAKPVSEEHRVGCVSGRAQEWCRAFSSHRKIASPKSLQRPNRPAPLFPHVQAPRTETRSLLTLHQIQLHP